MCLRPANLTIPWRHLPLLLILCLCAVSAFAQVPVDTIRRIAQLKVQAIENQRLSSTGELDARTYNLRRRAIEDELKPLLGQLDGLSPQGRHEAETRIENWKRTLLAVLQPQSEPPAKGKRQQKPQRAAVSRNTAASRLPAGSTRTSPDDYQRDVAIAANLATRRDPGPEFTRLRDKWRAAGRGDEFIRDYLKYQMDYPQRRAAAAAALRQDPSRTGLDTDPPHSMVVTVLIMRALIVASLIWAFLRRRRLRKSGVQPARLTRTWWLPPLVAIMLLWAAPIGFTGNSLTQGDIENLTTRGFTVLGVLGAAYLFHRIFRHRPIPERPPSTVYGTAHYAPLQTQIKDENCLAKGVFLGKSSAPELARAPLNAPVGVPICTTPEHHTLIVARTRTGKGTRVIVPTLLRYGGSALVIDPKGENAAITAAPRRDQLGQTIHILNPWNALSGTYQRRGFTPATYNPLDILDRNDPNAVAIAQTLAAAICPAPPNSKETFWQGRAASVLAAVFLWLTYRPETKTLARAREIVSLTRKKFTDEYLVEMSVSDAFGGAIREMATPFIDLAQETYSGIMANLSESTKFLSDPQVKAATAQSSFAMDELATGKTTLYVVIPTERMDTQRTWLRLIISAGMHIFKNPSAKLPRGHRCLFLIDEFAALGRINEIPSDISTMSGFGVDFALIVQGLGQLKDHYADSRNEILDNCAYKWFCNVNDLDSAEYVSKTLGKATVETTSTSDSVSAGSNSSSRSQSTTRGETGRPLLNPDEVLTLGRDIAIAMQPYGHPYYLKPVDYWSLPDAFAALEEICPHLYWHPPLSYDENPYFTPPPPPGGGDGQSRDNEKAKSAPPPPRKPTMTRDEALEIFELGKDATREEIQAAYRSLIIKYHPDHGGTNHFARELNEAKSILLGE